MVNVNKGKFYNHCDQVNILDVDRKVTFQEKLILSNFKKKSCVSIRFPKRCHSELFYEIFKSNYCAFPLGFCLSYMKKKEKKLHKQSTSVGIQIN